MKTIMGEKSVAHMHLDGARKGNILSDINLSDSILTTQYLNSFPSIIVIFLSQQNDKNNTFPKLNYVIEIVYR